MRLSQTQSSPPNTSPSAPRSPASSATKHVIKLSAPHAIPATSNGDAVWEDCLIATHNNPTVSASHIGIKHDATVDTSCSSPSSSTLSPEALNPSAPGNYGEGNTDQNTNSILENSQIFSFSSDENLVSSTQDSQSSLPPIPDRDLGDYNENLNEIFLQTQYSAANGPGDFPNLPQTMNSVGMGIFPAMPAGIDHALHNNGDFYNPQGLPTLMTYPAMAFNNGTYPLGFPCQMYRPPRPRIYCAWPLCMESFARPGDLERHRQSVHLGIKHHCSWPRCHNNHGKGYVRFDKLRAHQREKHGF